MSGQDPKLLTTTIRDYDLAQASSGPLFIQSLMGLKGLYDSKIVQVTLLGKKEERPFKVVSMFGAATGPQTDAAAIAEAEKRVGKKDD